ADTSTSGRETVPSSRSSSIGVPSSVSGTTMGRLIPVPWQLFNQSWNNSRLGTSNSSAVSSLPSGQQNLVLNIDESKLRSAPSFDASNWNELQGGSFDQRIYSYFGVDRSSTATGTSGSSISGQGASSYDRNHGRTSNDTSIGSNGSSSIGSRDRTGSS